MGPWSCLQQTDKHLRSAGHTSVVLEPTPGRPVQSPQASLGLSWRAVRVGGPCRPSQPVCPENGSPGPPSGPSADCRLFPGSGQEPICLWRQGSGAGAFSAPRSWGRCLHVGGVAVWGGCAHLLCLRHFRRTLPTQGRAQRGAVPSTGGLRGSPVLSSQVAATETSSLGPRGFLQGLEGHQGTEELEETQARLHPPVARRGHWWSQGRLPWTGDGQACLSGWHVQHPGTHQPLPSCEGPACPQETPTSADAGRSALMDQFIEALPRPSNAARAQDTCLNPHHPGPSHRHSQKGRLIPVRMLQTLGREQAPSSPPRGARLLSLVTVSSASMQLSKKPFLSLPVGPPLSHALEHLTSGA